MRSNSGRLAIASWFVFLFFIFLSGCATTTFERGHPRVYKMDHIKKIAVLPFGNVEFTDEIIERLVNNSKWRVVDQGTLEKIMKEYDLSNNGIIDKKTAVKLGRSAGVDLVVFGEYRNTSVVVKAADVETAEYLAYENIDLEGYKGLDFRAAKAVTVLIPFRIKFIDGNPTSIVCGDLADKKFDEE